MSSRQDGYLVDDSQGFDEFLGAFFLGLLAAATIEPPFGLFLRAGPNFSEIARRQFGILPEHDW